MSDMTTLYPEGLSPILSDIEIDKLEDYYQKPIEKISHQEVDSFLSFGYEDYL